MFSVVRTCMSRFLHIPPKEPSATPLLDKEIRENRVRSCFLVVPGVTGNQLSGRVAKCKTRPLPAGWSLNENEELPEQAGITEATAAIPNFIPVVVSWFSWCLFI